jgi:uncharacterized protein
VVAALQSAWRPFCLAAKLFGGDARISASYQNTGAVDIMRLKLAPGLTVKRSRINGRGCFATTRFERWRKIAEYAGERISNAEAKHRASRRILRICGIDNRWSLDGSRGGNGTHYVNHSCEPNAFTRTVYGHLLFFALRAIEPGEEITIDYESTLHPDKKKCSCGVKSCRGTINKVS